MSKLDWQERSGELRNILSEEPISPAGKKALVDILKNIYGDDFPFDDWDDFVQTLKEINDPEYSITAIMDEFWEDTEGVGCKFPLFVQPFNFNTPSVSASFSWSSAADVGWIEEHIGWSYQRLWEDVHEPSRDWYPFERLSILVARMIHLYKAETERGVRFRKYWSPMIERVYEQKLLDQPDTTGTTRQLPANPDINVVELQEEQSTSIAIRMERIQRKKQRWKEGKLSFSLGPPNTTITRKDDTFLDLLDEMDSDSKEIKERWKEARKSLSDIAPGLGQWMDHRIQSLLNRSFENQLLVD